MQTTPSPDVHSLAARIEKLEASNRRWKSAGAIAPLFVISLLLLSTRPAERVAAAAEADRIDTPVIRAGTIEAQEFVLKDTEGRVYARLSLSPLLKALASNNFSPNNRVFGLPNRNIPDGAAALLFYDENGNVTWSAPTRPGFLPVK